MRIVVRCLVLAGMCVALAPRPAAADVDVTGKWLLNLVIYPVYCLDFIQSGTAITAVNCDNVGSTYTGTIDPMTGAFDMAQPATPCVSVDPGWSEFHGTVTPDSNSMSGNYISHFYKTTPPVGCSSYANTFTGAREHCGDSYVNTATEQCDDGGDTDHCCNPSCQFFADGMACNDGNGFTTSDTCSAGTCVGSNGGMDFQVNTYTTNTQSYPAVACQADGDFIVTWAGRGPTDTKGIYGRRYASGGVPLGTQFSVNTYTTFDQHDAAVATAPNGDFTVVWTDGQYPEFVGRDGSYYAIYAQRFDSSGTPLGTDFQVNTYTTGPQVTPDIASLGTSGTVMVWTSYGQDYDDGNGNSSGVFGQRFDSNGAMTGTEFQVNTYITGPQHDPSVASDGSGKFVVVWTEGDISAPVGVMGRRYGTSGLPIGTEFAVTADTSEPNGNADVAVDPAGNFVVTWHRVGQIYGRRFLNNGAPAGSEFLVKPYTNCSNFTPSVTVDATGKFTIAWVNTCQDGSFEGIFAKQYNSGGMQIGPEFLVNAYTSGAEWKPSICATPDGGFVATWQEDPDSMTSEGDGSGSGIFGALPPVPPPLFDHYKCYQGTDLKTPPFDKIDAVATSDQITSEPVKVNKLKFVCAPVDKNGEGIKDATTHLACYQVKGANLEPRPRLEGCTQFQMTRFELKKPRLLCLPTAATVLP